MNNIYIIKAKNSITKLKTAFFYIVKGNKKHILLLAFLCLICIVIGLIIYSKLPNRQLLECNPSKEGWENFINIFHTPLSLFWHSIIAYGIYIAILKFYQSERNIVINNYYLHQNEFIMSIEFLVNDIIENKPLKTLLHIGIRDDKTLKDYEDFLRQKITKYFSANLYKIWFGHLHYSNLHIKKNVLLEAEKLYNTYLALKENKLYCTPDNLNKIIPFVKELGLESILVNTNSETSNIYVYLVFKICKHILEFDHKEISNQKELYERLKI